MSEPGSLPGSLHSWRVEYTGGDALSPEGAPAAPLDLFQRWLLDARAAGLPEPNAMTLATADASGYPSARMVLLKAADSRGFSFFTNYGSRKASELAVNARAALVFPWFGMQRQVIARGSVMRLPEQESAEYFAERPRAAQLGAWASPQSQPIEEGELRARLAGLVERFAEVAAIPRPEHWGGFLVVPDVLEFWVGQRSRLHDRLEYRRVAVGGLADGAAWQRRRLAP